MHCHCDSVQKQNHTHTITAHTLGSTTTLAGEDDSGRQGRHVDASANTATSSPVYAFARFAGFAGFAGGNAAAGGGAPTSGAMGATSASPCSFRTCSFRDAGCANRLSHPGWKHTYRFSPRWLRSCARRFELDSTHGCTHTRHTRAVLQQHERRHGGVVRAELLPPQDR